MIAFSEMLQRLHIVKISTFRWGFVLEAELSEDLLFVGSGFQNDSSATNIRDPFVTQTPVEFLLCPESHRSVEPFSACKV